MDAGKLNRRGTIQMGITTQDSFGQPVAGWFDVFDCWARMKPLSGQQLELAMQLHAESNYEITVRYDTRIKTNMRFIYNSRIFQINDTHDIDDRHEWLLLSCKEMVA